MVAGIAALGVDGVRAVRTADLYFLSGELTEADVERLCRELLADPVVQEWKVTRQTSEVSKDLGSLTGAVVEVGLHPGVTDPVADSLLHGARTIGVTGLRRVATGQRYVLEGELSEADVHRIARQLLCNEVIQHYRLGRIEPHFAPAAGASDAVETIPIRAASPDELLRISRERVLSLDAAEMAAIRRYFVAQGRDPTDVELETLAQTWSEHCVHKTFKGVIEYREIGERSTERRETIHSLFKTYIVAATERAGKPWVRSAFVDNAGVIDFDDEHEVSFKVETHNHPSALEPFGGANTGVGGVVRDIIGVSHRPIANTDVLCFGPQDVPFEALPEGVLHPRRVAEGVVAGIEDYGNKMGIPTVNGAILFDEGYTANPLVYCGTVGIAPKGRHRRAARPGDLAVMIGGRIGRDGLHGATFSSAELTHETGATVGSVVQIGNPIVEKNVLEAVLRARDEGLYTAITDCGAGGLSSAVGEMGAEVGVRVQLADAPLKYQGLRPWEIWLSEAQERMVLAVPPERLERLRQVCAGFDVKLTVVGQFTGDRRLTVCHGQRVVAELAMDFLHHGVPRRRLPAVWQPPVHPEPPPAPADSLTRYLLRILSSPNVRSKEAVIRVYDHEVQGGTVVKPLVGGHEGPSDAAVIKPLGTAGHRGLAIAGGINPCYGAIDPYLMAVAAVDEAVRNAVAVGGDPDRLALLDNFCWGNPNLPDRLGALVRAAKGCHDGAVAYGVPFISGKDSLNNEYRGPDGQPRPIPHTLLISALAIVPDVRRAVTMDAKEPGDALYVVGETRDELGGSHYYRVRGYVGRRAPQPAADGPRAARALHRAMRAGLVRAAHDCSEGGLGVAVAEMALAGGRGLDLFLDDVPLAAGVTRPDVALFSESNGRWVVEVRTEDRAAFEAALAGVPCALAGCVREGDTVRFWWRGERVVEVGVERLRGAWRGLEGVASTT